MKIKRGLQTIIIIVCTGYDDVTFMAFLYKKTTLQKQKEERSNLLYHQGHFMEALLHH